MNIERMHFDEQDIWVPDIKVFNIDGTSDVHPFGEVPILVDHDGRTYWFPPTHIQVPCDLDLSSWPSDEHECIVRMGSWTHRGEQLDTQLLEHNGTAISLDVYEENNRWELVKVEGKRQEITLDVDTYYEIDFHFTLRRTARTQAIYITQSTLAMVVVVLASYCLPLRLYYTRIIMHLLPLSVLIGCFFTLFAKLPANGGPVPLIVRYYSGTIVLTTISLLSTIFLTTQACCLSSSSSSYSSKRLVGIVASTPGLRNVINGNYNHLDSELGEEMEETRPQPSTSQETTTASDDTQNSTRGHTVRRIINFLLFLLFTIAFCVDYTVLRSVA
ncbi:neuronal acetylcholine receptor subunit alpha-6-like [Penaeus japonicus]|uniref:neuronal acetylcholine receptor subunit alpha-6-like n=1 Tax=Penaeus japonicus TaxID=27405 RepID=UPI001C70F337|nr:neuronal acetylcholine receptor subunit alpha-6-like [Penaeus japonicus]